MSSPTNVGRFRFPVRVRVGPNERGDLSWWTDAAPGAVAPRGRVYHASGGYAADSPSLILIDHQPVYPTPEAAADAALLREACFAPVVASVRRVFFGPSMVFLTNGNDPETVWPWRPVAGARPENMPKWERVAVAAAAAYRRYSVVFKDLDEGRTWIIESVFGEVGIVRMPAAEGEEPLRWLARAGRKQPLMGRARP